MNTPCAGARSCMRGFFMEHGSTTGARRMARSTLLAIDKLVLHMAMKVVVPME